MDGIERLLELGRMDFVAGSYEVAHQHLEKALALDPSNQEAQKLLAMVEELLNRNVAEDGRAVQSESKRGQVIPKAKMDEIERLLELGHKDLEAGYPDYARQYFEKVLALDSANREAIDALARIDELYHRAAAPVKPIQAEPVKPPCKVERKRSVPEKKHEEQERSLTQWFKRLSRRSRITILASVPLMLCCLCAGLADMISPRPEVTPEVFATQTAEAPMAAPTSSVLEESVRKQVFLDWVDAQSSGVEDEDVARRWGITVDVVQDIATEGFEKSWPRLAATATPIPRPPTNTPKPPTDTPAPTSTPIPLIATPIPGFSAEEKAYALEMIGITDDYASSMFMVSALMKDASENAWLVLDDEWRLEMAIGLAIWKVCGERIRALNAPPRLQGVHLDFVQAAKHIDRTSTLLAQGIDEIDVDKINEAEEQMLLGNEYINQAAAKVEALQQSR